MCHLSLVAQLFFSPRTNPPPPYTTHVSTRTYVCTPHIRRYGISRKNASSVCRKNIGHDASIHIYMHAYIYMYIYRHTYICIYTNIRTTHYHLACTCVCTSLCILLIYIYIYPSGALSTHMQIGYAVKCIPYAMSYGIAIRTSHNYS